MRRYILCTFGFIVRILDTGKRDDMDAEMQRTLHSLNIFHILVLSMGIFMLFEIARLSAYAYLPLACITVFGALGCFYLLRRGLFSKYPSIALMVWITTILCVMISRGLHNGQPYLWLFVFPFLQMMAFGLKKGAILLAATTVALLLLFALPGTPLLYVDYPAVLRERIFVAYLFSCFAAGGSEVVRWSAHKKIQSLMAQLAEASQTDELTKLFNRRAFRERIAYEVERARRSGQPFCIVLGDIDHFKKVNDTYGHQGGDEALRLLATILSTHTRKQDTVARWGGEEFIILLPGTDLAGAVSLAEKLRQIIEATPCQWEGPSFHFTLSMGVHQCDATKPVDGEIQQADEFLYKAKELGRNRVVSAQG